MFVNNISHVPCMNMSKSKGVFTKLTGKNCFTQFSTRMAAWLLLTFFICLHIQLSSCTFQYHARVQMFERGNSSNRQQKRMVVPFSRFYGKIWVGFCFNTGRRFFLEVSS